MELCSSYPKGDVEAALNEGGGEEGGMERDGGGRGLLGSFCFRGGKCPVK